MIGASSVARVAFVQSVTSLAPNRSALRCRAGDGFSLSTLLAANLLRPSIVNNLLCLARAPAGRVIFEFEQSPIGVQIR